MNRDCSQWLATQLARTGFYERYPGYVCLLAGLEVTEDPSVAAMAVSRVNDRFRLHINLGFFQAKARFLPGVLLHEIHHLVLGHLTRPELHEVAFPDLMELAMEIAANEYIREPLPGAPPRWEEYRRFGLEAHQSTWERYERLANARRDGTLRVRLWRAVDDHRFLAAAPDDDRGTALVETLLARLPRERPFFPSESPTRIAGRTPGELLILLRTDPRRPPPALDWRQAIAAFPARLRTPQRGYSYARPNRRFPTRVGEIPGRARRSIGHLELLVAIDTSSSMEEPTLVQIARQVSLLASHAAITVVECDAAIQRVYPFTGAIRDLRGRGGTDLRPVFEPAFLARHSPDGILYFTDGEGPWPAEAPTTPTLWVLTGPMHFACPWGRQARMPAG